MKFNKNEFGWKEKVSVNTDELVTKNDIPHYNEILMFEISGEDYRFFRNNSYFNMNALNIDETKSYVGKDINITDDEEYTFKFVYNKEADVLICEDIQTYIYNHKSYNGENFIENENSAVLTYNITTMDISESEINRYFRLYEVEKLELDTNCLPDNVSIPNSLTVGTRIGDIGEFSVSEGDGNTASGERSHAEGSGTTASGNYSHAEGRGTTASGEVSHAEGCDTTASGAGSHAEGDSTEASGTSSHAEGYFTTASGDYSHAEGYYTTASGDYSHAEGDSTEASGEDSHAEGYENTASGYASHAEGYENTASGYASHAEGEKTTALGTDSHAEGKSTEVLLSVIQDLSSSTTDDTIITVWNTNKFSLAKGTSSHVEGKDNLALGDFSHAEGSNTTASGENSHTEGSNTTASGVVSHAEGESTIASGVVSHAEGFNTRAGGNSSHAEGFNTIASGNTSHAEGFKTIASSGNQHVQGKYNIDDTANKYAHIVGNGTSDNARSNAHTLDWQGNAWYSGKLSQDGTPTEDKDLTTKKYVDDSIANQPTFSFNDSGELVVTIGNVTKIFVPKQ